ncbi:ATP-dependent DNA helicase pif3 [Ancistrocladus abbreviatus]
MQDQEDDLVPWLNYPIEEPLQNDYCSDLLHELSGVTANDLSSGNSLASMKRRNGFNHVAGSSHVNSAHNALTLQQGSVSNASSGAVELSRAKSGEVSPLMQFQKAVLGSGVSAISINGVKPQKHDAGQPNCSSGFLSFSHFSRPAVLARAALLCTDATAGPVLSGTERSGKEDTVCALSSSNPPESSLVDLTKGS